MHNTSVDVKGQMVLWLFLLLFFAAVDVHMDSLEIQGIAVVPLDSPSVNNSWQDVKTNKFMLNLE